MSAWLAALPPSVAAILGTLIGSSLGLFALLAGALFNARLNRARDDRLRLEESRSVRSALMGELSGVRDAFNKAVADLDVSKRPTEGSFNVPHIELRLVPILLPKFGLLPADIVREVIDVSVVIEQFYDTIMLFGGKLGSHSLPNRRSLMMQIERASLVANFSRDIAARIDPLIAKLSDSS